MKKLFLILLLVLISVTFTWENALSASKVKSNGVLTSIESEDVVSVIIDNKGYIVDPSALILDRMKSRVSLYSLKLPIKVDFEYKYTTKGFIIILIEELPEKRPE